MDRIIALFPVELPDEEAAHLLQGPGELGSSRNILAGQFWWPRCLPGAHGGTFCARPVFCKRGCNTETVQQLPVTFTGRGMKIIQPLKRLK